MEKRPIDELLQSVMSKVHEMVDVNTVVGTPITTADGITIIPVSEVKFGFASGGSEFPTKQPGKSDPFGGGVGAGVNIKPVAFMVVKDGLVRMVNVSPPPDTTVDKIIDMAPDIMDRVENFIDKKAAEKSAAKKSDSGDVDLNI